MLWREQAGVACEAYIRWSLQGPGAFTFSTLLRSFVRFTVC
jgi:hypothetical protein